MSESLIPQSPISRRDVFRYGLGASAVIALGGLAPAVANATSASAATRVARAASVKRGGTLKFARSVAPTTLDPANTIIAGDIYTLDKIFEPLYITTPTGSCPLAGDRLHREQRHQKTLTFALRPGVKFSDGSPLTADDVVFSINRSRTTRPARSASWTRRSPRSRPSGTSTVVVKLSAALGAVHLGHLGLRQRDHAGQLRRQVAKRSSSRTPIGTGPFTLSVFTPDASSLTLKKNPHYWQAGKPYLDSSSSSTSTTTTSACCRSRAARSNIIDSVPPADVAGLKWQLERRLGAVPGLGGRPARPEREAAPVR